MPTISKFTLIKRRSDLTNEEFTAHWRTIHADALASLPEFWKYNTRYIQNHRLPLPGILGPEPFWDGIATTVQRPRPDMQVGLWDEPAYMEVVRPDELNFISMDDTTAVFGEEHIIKDGPRDGVKFMSFMGRKLGITHEQFLDHWSRIHGPLVQDVAPFWRHVRRYVQNFGIPALSKPLTKSGNVEAFSGVAELWFDSVDDVIAAFSEPEFIERVGPDGPKFLSLPTTRFLVREHEVVRPADLKAGGT